jgi:RNA polymerase sigma-70 factor (ECF subfamily)
MNESPNPSIEALLAHVGWVRKLAREITRDAFAAEDLAQSTLAAALERRPEPGRGLASWLAGTIQNLGRQERRRSYLREKLEPLAARDEAVSGADRLAEQADLQHTLVEYVLALEEPHKRTLLLRYFANLSPREMARHERVPVATVTSRLTRAHQKLREKLERAHGGTEWLAAFAPLLHRPELVSTVTLGGALLNAKIVISAAAIAAAAVAFVWVRSDNGADPEHVPLARDRIAATSELDQPAAGANEIDVVTSKSRESAAVASARPIAERATETPASKRVRGRIVDSDGAPLAGLAVGWSGTKAGSVQSGALGWFELQTSLDSGGIDVLDPAWTTVRSGMWRADSRLDPIVIAARSLDLAGTVRDDVGRALAGARVAFVLPAGFATRFEGSLEATQVNGWRSLSDANGRFALDDAPSIAGARLRAVLEGYAMAEIDEPPARDDGLTIVLQRPKTPLQGALRGRVVDERGVPVPTARVFLGLASTTTDEEGRFALSLSRAVTSDRISAIKSGHRPAVLDRPRPPRGDETGWPDSIELQLPGPSLSLRGVVVDRDDHPRAGIRVWLADPSPAGTIGYMPTFAENLMAGAPIPAHALESESRAPASDGDTFNDFYQRVGPSNAFWHWVLTDDEGRFELRGLDDRRYRLRLMDPKSLEITTSDEHRAGSENARIVMPAPDLLPLLAGRVLDDEGRAVAGANVRLEGEAVGVRTRVFGGRVYVSVRAPREHVRTGDDGRFEFRDVPRANIQLRIESEQIIPCEVFVAEQAKPDALEVRVYVRCSFQVQITSRDLVADAVAVSDAEGRPLDIFVLDSGAVNAYTDVAIVDGRTGVVSTSSAASTLSLLRDGEVVKRATIRLRPEGTNRIEL